MDHAAGDENDQGRWGALFADLSGQLDEQDALEQEADHVDRVRHERGQVQLADRLRAAVGGIVRIGVIGRPPLQANVIDVGPDWVLIRELGAEVLVASPSIEWIEGLPPRGRLSDGSRWRTPDLRRILRERVQSGEIIRIELTTGDPLRGVVTGVFADHIDIAQGADDCQRAQVQLSMRSVPLSAIVLIRSAT
jgi:hypothetical protein